MENKFDDTEKLFNMEEQEIKDLINLEEQEFEEDDFAIDNTDEEEFRFDFEDELDENIDELLSVFDDTDDDLKIENIENNIFAEESDSTFEELNIEAILETEDQQTDKTDTETEEEVIAEEIDDEEDLEDIDIFKNIKENIAEQVDEEEIEGDTIDIFSEEEAEAEDETITKLTENYYVINNPLTETVVFVSNLFSVDIAEYEDKIQIQTPLTYPIVFKKVDENTYIVTADEANAQAITSQVTDIYASENYLWLVTNDKFYKLDLDQKQLQILESADLQNVSKITVQQAIDILAAFISKNTLNNEV